MDDPSQESLRQLLERLLHSWHHENPRRATGGWWALAGFAFQTSTFLLRFFKNLEKTDTGPEHFAEMEQLSDILSPQDGCLTLIHVVQVKRTLTKATLASALEEAYLITDLCKRKTPDLLQHLQFQVACRQNPASIRLADLTMVDVVGELGDVSCWNTMLDRFNPLQPILIDSDPLDQLYVYLWNAGIRDIKGFLDQCRGRLLDSFSEADATTIRRVARDLADIFYREQKRDKPHSWNAFGEILTKLDVLPNPNSFEDKGVLVGQNPKIEHLRKGLFLDREHIFDPLWNEFSQWLLDLDDHDDLIVDERIDVFWISGRSGEGKSIMLLQLVAKLLCSAPSTALLHLDSGQRIPRFMEAANDRLSSSLNGSRVLAVVDDIYDVRNRDYWDETVRSATSLHTPPVAIITCGPTEQRDHFTSRLSDQFKVKSFSVPNLKLEECRRFLTWYARRTGINRSFDILTTDNPLLVQVMFELAQGANLSYFAKRFKRRLEYMKVFEETRTFLAVNALYMDAPLALCNSDASRDALEHLCNSEQLHFRIVQDAESGTKGVRLAHAHLSWLLFIEWADLTPATLSKVWARELSKALLILESSNEPSAAGDLLYQLLVTSRMSDADASVPEPFVAYRVEVIRELFRLHCGAHGGYPTPQTLPRWLDFQFKIENLNLNPDPVSCAVAELSKSPDELQIHASVAGWVWILSERSLGHEVIRMREAAESFLKRYPNNFGVGGALTRLYTQAKDNTTALAFIMEWIRENSDNPQAVFVIGALISRNPTDPTIMGFATKWLQANPRHPQAYHVIAPMVAVDPTDPSIIGLATEWLRANSNHPHAYHVIAPMVAGNRTDPSIIGLATEWLLANSNHPQVYHVIEPMLAGKSTDLTTIRLAIEWLQDNSNHPHAYHVIAPMVAGNPTDPSIIGLATEWLQANSNHPQAYWLISPLVAGNPTNAAIIELATEWLQANSNHPQAYHVIEPMLAGKSTDLTTIRLAVEWLRGNSNHPHAYHIIAPMVAGNPTDPSIIGLATEWLQANSNHPQAYWLISPLVAGNPTNPAIMRLASEWLEHNENHPRSYWLLCTVIPRSDGAEEWLSRGMQYLKRQDCQHPERIIAVLLTAGKADSKYIDFAFDYTSGSIARGHRNFVLNNLSRALVSNIDNGMKYLNGPFDERRKKLICRSIAIGMKHYPKKIPGVINSAAFSADSCYGYLILKNVIIEKVESDSLDRLIAKWLNGATTESAYRSVLRALQADFERWKSIVKLGVLDPQVLEDFRTMLRAE